MSGIIGGAGSKSGIIGETEIDYEEGVWTLGVLGGTLTIKSGAMYRQRYIKIGSLVHVQTYLEWNNNGDSTGLTITGLPFTVGNHNKFYNSVSIGYAESLAIPDDTSISGYGGQNTTTIVLWNWDDAAGGTALQHSEITADGIFFITTTYFV